MKRVPLERLSKDMRSRVLEAIDEPVLMTEGGDPILVLRSLLDDDIADELIAQHPDFQASVRRAREQLAAGQGKTLAELQKKYAAK